MVEDSLITEELKDKICIELEPMVCEVEKGMIQRFVLAIDDPNCLWRDEEFASKSRYGGIVAPPINTGITRIFRSRAILISRRTKSFGSLSRCWP